GLEFRRVLFRSIVPTSSAIPPVPTGLIALANNNQASLSWTSVSGATSYNIKRSLTSSGPYYTTVATITDTNYTDTNLWLFTAYYYVVSATNASGESVQSSEVSALTTGMPAAPSIPTVLNA